MNPVPRIRVVSLVALGVFAVRGWGAPPTPVDAELPSYAASSGVSGNLDSIGSDTLNNLLTLWAEAFKVIHPNVNIQIEGKGSSTAPTALIEGTAQLGPMSRMMKPTEIDQFESRHGYKPTLVPVAIDAPAIYVHKDNPLEVITLRQVDSVFSSTFRRGGGNIERWGGLGLTGPWDRQPISTYGRNSASGTYGLFKEVAMRRGDFKPTVKEQPGSSSVVQGVSNDLYGIGYAGIGYRTSGVKILALGTTLDDVCAPTYENCVSQAYPLARFLYIYVNKSPVEPFDPLTREFLRFVLSREGQAIVVKDGYYPLTAEYVFQVLEVLE